VASHSSTLCSLLCIMQVVLLIHKFIWCRYSFLFSINCLNHMIYASLETCLTDLEKHGHLVRIKEEVDPYLEMASIHLRVHEAKGPALLFENVKDCQFKAASNIFGTIERSKFIFRKTFQSVQKLIELRNNPSVALKKPFKN